MEGQFTWIGYSNGGQKVHICVNLKNMRKIDFFRTGAGDCPVENFLDGLSGKQTQKVVWVMQLVEDLEKVPKQYFKKIGEH